MLKQKNLLSTLSLNCKYMYIVLIYKPQSLKVPWALKGVNTVFLCFHANLALFVMQ